MKNFINVLYRRILYKIPLKLLLILLAIFWLLFACTKAEFSDPVLLETYSNWANNGSYSNANYDILCIQNWNCADRKLVFNFTHWVWIYYSNLNNDQWMACTISGAIYFDTTNSSCIFYIYWINVINYSSQQCQTEYNLIPIEDVDQNYCTTNNLCPSWWTPSDCPNVWVSNLWINDIFHPWAFNIYMNIPQELDRDYAYTNSWANFNLDIVGYNVDYDYIDWVVDSQNYKPNSDDLSSIVSQIIPLFVPWLCIILLLYFIFRFIKKIF